MSVIAPKSLICDVELVTGPCEAEFGADFCTSTELRRKARAEGWSIRRVQGNTYDKCPECTRAGR